MEEATSDAINKTVGTLADKAVTGAIKNNSTETIDKAAEERVKAAEEQVMILEEKLKALEEKLKVTEDTFAIAVHDAVQIKVERLEEAMESRIVRVKRMAKFQAQIDSVSESIQRLHEIS